LSVRARDGRVKEGQILGNPFLDEEKARGIRVAEWLTEHKADVVLIREDLSGKGPVYVFGDAGIELRQTSVDTLEEVVHNVEENGA
jgi:predicted Fe-Mo cluster-binding NifX family protein